MNIIKCLMLTNNSFLFISSCTGTEETGLQVSFNNFASAPDSDLGLSRGYVYYSCFPTA